MQIFTNFDPIIYILYLYSTHIAIYKKTKYCFSTYLTLLRICFMYLLVYQILIYVIHVRNIPIGKVLYKQLKKWVLYSNKLRINKKVKN